MICIIALIVFGVLGIFSASYRIIAKEAFECVFRRLTLRKCETGLDKRLKAQITGRLMKRLPRTGRQIYKYFEVISWIFLILLLVSIFFSAQGAYLFVKYGNCNGEDSNKFCIFDPLNTMGYDVGSEGTVTALDQKLVQRGDYSGYPSIGNPNAPVTIIEFGCFACLNTKDAEPIVKQILDKYGDEIYFVYVNFPLKHHEFSYELSVAAKCVWLLQPELYWGYHSKLFEVENGLSNELLRDAASELGVDLEPFDNCISGEVSKTYVDEDIMKGMNSNVYGTPTFFIEREPLVGVTSYKEFKKIIESKLK